MISKAPFNSESIRPQATLSLSSGVLLKKGQRCCFEAIGQEKEKNRKERSKLSSHKWLRSTNW